MTDCRAVCYLIFLNFYDAPLPVGLFSEHGDINRARRLIVIDSTVHGFLCMLSSVGTPWSADQNFVNLSRVCITYISFRLADKKMTPFRTPFDLEEFFEFQHTTFATEVTLGKGSAWRQ
jgi:hypothetical protein